MHQLELWLQGLPPILVYLVVGGIIGLESLGIPLPGEITLVTASLMASQGVVAPWGVALAASTGAIVGDSIGYMIGHSGGRALLVRMGKKFPSHLGPAQLARAEGIFARWGVWAVFFGRFVAVLRILAGPLAGALKVPYGKFLLANATGGIVWATGTTYVIYAAGQAAERWLSGFSWVALIIAVVFGIITTLIIKHRTSASMAKAAAQESAERLEPEPSHEK